MSTCTARHWVPLGLLGPALRICAPASQGLEKTMTTNGSKKTEPNMIATFAGGHACSFEHVRQQRGRSFVVQVVRDLVREN